MHTLMYLNLLPTYLSKYLMKKYMYVCTCYFVVESTMEDSDRKEVITAVERVSFPDLGSELGPSLERERV